MFKQGRVVGGHNCHHSALLRGLRSFLLPHQVNRSSSEAHPLRSNGLNGCPLEVTQLRQPAELEPEPVRYNPSGGIHGQARWSCPAVEEGAYPRPKGSGAVRRGNQSVGRWDNIGTRPAPPAFGRCSPANRGRAARQMGQGETREKGTLASTGVPSRRVSLGVARDQVRGRE